MFTFRSLVLPLTAIALTACADRAHEDPLGETGALTTGQANDGAAAGACLETLDRSSEPAAYLQCQHQLLEAFESRLARRMDKGSEGWEGTTSWVENETRFLTRLTLVFLARRAINDGPDWQATSEQFDQRLQSYRQNLLRNPHVIDGIRRDLERLTLTTPPEERRLIEQNWQQLQRSGVFLSAADADRLQSIDQTLGELQGLFRDNLDRATLRYETLITDPRRLDGLSIDQIAKARQDAEDRGHEEGWVLTLKRHRLYPALRQLRDREQRQALHQAHQFRAGGMRVGQVGDNPELMRRILSLRLERARLLGFDHALAFQLADSGLASIEMLYELLDAMERAAKPIAAREVDRLRLALQGDGFEVEPQAWDLLYYTHREEKRATADGQPEVAVSEMQALDALFASAQALWDLEFEPLTGIGGSGLPRFQVHDGQGKPLGAVTFDLGHRRGKRGGAWMSVLQHAETDGQQRSPAIVEIQSNFGPGEPGALSLDANAVETLFHEFGHVLMELFSATRHRSLAGNQLPPDAIEVPALIFERLAF
ncbi:MAG: M3 family metallopeptidase, partial [Pseudomonadota bacterium]